MRRVVGGAAPRTNYALGGTATSAHPTRRPIDSPKWGSTRGPPRRSINTGFVADCFPVVGNPALFGNRREGCNNDIRRHAQDALELPQMEAGSAGPAGSAGSAYRAR